MRRNRPLPLLALGLLALSWMEPRAAAHEGPPYPLITGWPTRYGRVSAWGDPDVGTGTFWIVLEPSRESPQGHAKVSVTVQPVDGRLQAQHHPAWLIQDEPAARRFRCEVPFDAPGFWQLRVHLSGDLGEDEVGERIEVTPPGQGPVLDFILYSFPFAAVGGLFILAMVRRAAPRRSPGVPGRTAPGT